MVMMACSQAPQPAATASPAACRLPISLPLKQGGLQDAFLSFPTGKVTIDPSGNGGIYYDRPFKRWLPFPVDRHAVSSDGASYAYMDHKVPGTPQQSRLHVVDLSTGKDQSYDLGSPGDVSAYVVVDFAAGGIWLSYAGYESLPGGLLFLDLATGSLKDTGIPGITAPVASGQGVIWFTDPGPNPQQSGYGIGFTLQARVLRLTTADSRIETWFTKAGVNVSFVGADLAWHPVISTYANQGNVYEMWLAKSPTEAKLIGLPPGDYNLIADSHGLWFGSQQGIYLYSDAGKLQKVSDQPGYPGNGCF